MDAKKIRKKNETKKSSIRQRLWTTRSVDLNEQAIEEFVEICRQAQKNKESILINTARHRTAIIGTFNIEWLGGCPYEKPRGKVPKRNKEDYKKLAGIIQDTGTCLMALQEVVTCDALKEILKHLPGWGYILSRNINQKVAFIFDRSRVKYDAGSIVIMKEMADSKTFNYENLRPPLSVYMKVDNFDCNFIAVHKKSGFNLNSQSIRYKQCRMMNRWIKAYLENNEDKDLIILGDYNDMPESLTLQALREGDILNFSTGDLKKNEYTNIPHKAIIDHIGVTAVKGGAHEEVKFWTLKTIDEKKYPGYQKWASDHKPIFVCVDTEFDND
ncbi:MAG: hypothetical protein ACLFQV_07025 [Vulcanimicrobiota bacterium]